MLVLAKAQLWLPAPLFSLTAINFCAEWETWEQPGLWGLPLHRAALEVNASTRLFARPGGIPGGLATLEQAAELVGGSKGGEPRLDAVGDALMPGGAMERAGGYWARWEGKGHIGLLLPWLSPLSVPAAVLEPALLVTQGRAGNPLVCRMTTFIFTGFAKARCPALAWLRSSQTPAATGV